MTQDDKRPIERVDLTPSSWLKTFVWRLRVGLRDQRGGKDALSKEAIATKPVSRAVQRIYRKADDFIQSYMPNMTKTISKSIATRRVRDAIGEMEYAIVESDESKPWGAYYRLASHQAERFVAEFFPGLSLEEAKLGHDDVELSPKFLLVCPGQRLSWQYHHRRAERWRFLTAGAYHKSATDAQGRRLAAAADDVVQFDCGERHRLCANKEDYTLVAEIWQHTDPHHPSNEADIVRVADDYSR